MAYVAPDTELQFFQNLNLDPDYENTLYFATTQAKDAYFDALPSIKCPKCYYTREMRGYCRVEVPTSQLYGRTYMRFKNKQYENKWFYAFITAVEYINNNTTQVAFQIDVMMTWLGSYTLDQCFVERNHTATDEIGDNVVPEDFDIGTTVHNTIGTTGKFNNWGFLVVEEAAPDDTPARFMSTYTYGFYTALNYQIFNTGLELLTFFQNVTDREAQRILGIYYIPLDFKPNPPTVYAPVKYTTGHIAPIAGRTTLDGYIPKNNKLYTYPYYYMLVTNTEGGSKEFMFELSKRQGGGLLFEIRGILGEQTQISLIPMGYNTPNANDLNFTEAMNMTEFPMCGWNIDTYKAFLAQQLVQLPATLTGIAAAGAAGGLAGVTLAGERALETIIKGKISAERRPYEYKGKDTPQLALAYGDEFKDFYFYTESIRAYKAKILDDYFTMYGYAIEEVKQPSINVRPYYTYVKTVGCHINGSFPASDQREIEEVFNKGVRFWKEDHTHIGDYTVNNAPTNQNITP